MEPDVLAQYQRLQLELAELRRRRDQQHHPFEERILDRMDDLWWQMSPEQQDTAEAPSGKYGY